MFFASYWLADKFHTQPPHLHQLRERGEGLNETLLGGEHAQVGWRFVESTRWHNRTKHSTAHVVQGRFALGKNEVGCYPVG